MVEVGGKGRLVVGSGSWGSVDVSSGNVECRSSGKPVGLLGVWRSAVMRTAVMVGLLVLVVVLSSATSRSLLTQRVQAKVSPTYAAPNEAGRVRRGVRGDEFDIESLKGWAKVASGAMLRDGPGGPNKVAGRGVWVARDGRERRRTFSESECGADEG